MRQSDLWGRLLCIQSVLPISLSSLDLSDLVPPHRIAVHSLLLLGKIPDLVGRAVVVTVVDE